MRIISRKRLREFWTNNAPAKIRLTAWYKTVKDSKWKSFPELRKTFPSADRVKVESGDTMTVFNIGGNNYRLVAFVSYKAATVFTKIVMTHAEYDAGRWKDSL